MKNLFFFAIMSLLFVACNKEDKCVVDDFTGTYKLTNSTCETDPEDTDLVITSSGDSKIALELKYSDGSSLSFTDAFDVTECGYTGNIKDDDSDTDFTISGTLDGNSITVSFNGVFFGENTNCTETYEK